MNVEVLPGHSVLTPEGSYSPGQELALDEKEAHRLIAAGIVKPAAAATEPGQKANAAETIKLVEAATLDELEQLAAGDERKTVVAAIAKRRQELAAATVAE